MFAVEVMKNDWSWQFDVCVVRRYCGPIKEHFTSASFKIRNNASTRGLVLTTEL